MNKIERRTAIRGLSAMCAVATLANPSSDAAEAQGQSGLGIVMYDCNLRRRWMKQLDASFDLFDPFHFLQHCKSLAAGGAQISLGVMNSADAGRLRELAQRNGMFLDAIINPPQEKSDLSRFEAEVKTASEAGARSARTVIIPGRRYEQFKTVEEFRAFEARGRKMVELAVASVEKHQLPLAIENHKDQRIEERLALYEHIGSEFVGACVDTGNSLALLDDVYGAIEALAPHAFSVHFKDQALAEYEDGFLLADVPLGQGSFDLKRIAQILRAKKPQLRFSLEVITRDALQVPCLTDGYWKSLTEVRGSDLARTLRFVRQHPARGQSISSLPLSQQVEIEDSNVATSLLYAARELGI